MAAPMKSGSKPKIHGDIGADQCAQKDDETDADADVDDPGHFQALAPLDDALFLAQQFDGGGSAFGGRFGNAPKGLGLVEGLRFF